MINNYTDDELKEELNRREAFRLKAEYDRLDKISNFIKNHYGIFKKFNELLGGREFPEEYDVDLHSFDFYFNRLDIEKYYKDGDYVWNKYK